MADLIYSLAMSRVLKTMRLSLLNEGLSSSLVFPDKSIPLKDVSFVDDMALPIVARASDLVRRIADVCGIVYVVFKLYGMDLNVSPGKSAVILRFRGPGTKSAKIALKDAQDAIRINKLPESVGDVFIFVVKSYTHLGTLISFEGPCAEAAYRCGIMRVETAKFRSLLRNSQLPFLKKNHSIQAYLLSKGTFQCSTWVYLPVIHFKRFHGCILGMYRDAMGYYSPVGLNDLFSDDDLLFEHSLIAPMTMIRQARLLLFSRVLLKQPPLIMELVLSLSTSANSWVSGLLGDLRWLVSHVFFCAR